jgi:tetratricopeptide (TPR) repeat protein
MAKIGRNTPCPCGSGKKYKKCCMWRAPMVSPSATLRRTTHWSFEEIRTFSTAQIVIQLHQFGVAFQQAQFLQETEQYYSASKLAEQWYRRYPVQAEGFDGDFIWMACRILWDRLVPHKMCTEQVDDLIEPGFHTLDTDGEEAACALWKDVWEQLKGLVDRLPQLSQAKETERFFADSHYLYRWCEEYEMALWNGGLDNPTLCEERIRFCQEFCRYFPHTDQIVIQNMRRAEAETYYRLGRIDEGESCFRQLIQDYPDFVWGYIGWGDMYTYAWSEALPRDYNRAEAIYRMAIDRNLPDKAEAQDRLDMLQEERAKEAR